MPARYTMRIQPLARRHFALTLAAAAVCLSLAACGGGGSDDESTAQADAATVGTAQTAAVKVTTPVKSTTPAKTTASNVATTNTLIVGMTIPGYPHKIDVYRPAGATKAVVFLHPLGGRSWQVAYDLGLNAAMAPATTKNVNWDWLSKNGIIAVFPQGVYKAGTPPVPTWSNYVFDSGQDDVGMLKALSTYIRTNYGATEVSLAGHSDGGVMTARVWCEATPSFKSFVSLAGPMPSSTYPIPAPTCQPVSAGPYYMIVGGSDTKLPNFTAGITTPTPQQVAAGLTNTVLTSEWSRHVNRAQFVCGEMPTLDSSVVGSSGETWSSCNGQVRYTVVTKADHPIESIEQYYGQQMVDLVASFAKEAPAQQNATVPAKVARR